MIDARTASGSNAWFSKAQATIDVTGKAQDVLRRVKVRVPLHDRGGKNVPLGAYTQYRVFVSVLRRQQSLPTHLKTPQRAHSKFLRSQVALNYLGSGLLVVEFFVYSFQVRVGDVGVYLRS
ncbi:hypothetical protein IPL68_03865 [Candidatus Saccharibacteria bacterium]|nr:MAG: hypothetical protein IPL68_03865 [Candidatus Saccharibacteria bacterium]